MNLTIAILEDHTIFAEGLANMLAQEKQMQVLGHFQDYHSLLAGTANKTFEVLILDMRLPDTDGFEVCKLILKEHPELKILALSMFDDPALIKRMYELGAKGYARKDISRDELVEYIWAIHEGYLRFPINVMEGSRKSKPEKRKLYQSFLPLLSRREKEILRLVLDQYTNSEIADKLCIAIKTVEGHRANIFSKLNVKNMAGLTKMVVDLELLK